MEELRNKKDSWEERLKNFMSKFREDNMESYRLSGEYKANQEKIRQANEKIRNLGLADEVMETINDLGDIENAAAADYTEQAYLQGISDGIRFWIFVNQIGA